MSELPQSSDRAVQTRREVVANSFKNRPFDSTRKCRSGLASVPTCSQAGMFSIGAAKPESSQKKLAPC